MLQVGPESAGAHPGPVCYRKPGGLPALTDANLALGRILPVRRRNSAASSCAAQWTTKLYPLTTFVHFNLTPECELPVQDFFPHIFGPSEDQPLDAEAARAALTALAKDVNAGTPAGQAEKSVDEVSSPSLL